MSSAADGVIEGFFCEECFDVVDGEESGFPRKCNFCEELEEDFNE